MLEEESAEFHPCQLLSSLLTPAAELHQTPVSALLVEWDKAKCCSVQPSPCRADLELEMEMSSTSPSLSTQNLGTARNQPLKQQWKSLKTCFPWKDLSGMIFSGKPVLIDQLHEYLVLLGWGL